MSTPAARWRDEGKPDPHGNRYDCLREETVGGHLTDDEVANAVFLDPDLANLTIAKDRIRWLSRQVERVAERNRKLRDVLTWSEQNCPNQCKGPMGKVLEETAR